jgi:predicted metal-dependent peptidase
MFEQLEKRVGLTAAKMTLREPFIAAVFTKLNRTFTEEGTANVNGKRVQYGAKFCDALDDEELLFVSLHEGMHVVMMHMWRRDGRDPRMWNVANDAIINRMLVNKGYKMPQGGVLIDWVDERMSSEEVYAKLMQDRSGSGKGAGEPGDGEAGGWDGEGDLEDAPDAADAADIEATIVAAAKMAKAAGDKSALVDRILSGVLSASVSWTDVLRQVMTSTARDDYTFRRFNRRLISSNVYMPALHSDAMGGLVVGFDTSGSVDDAMCNRIAAEITAIAEDCHPEWVEVVYCDSEVKHTQRFGAGEAIALQPRGGGGTRFKPVFDHVERMGEKVCALVYLTDLEGNVNECVPPEYPVIWAQLGGDPMPVPFGERVEVRV